MKTLFFLTIATLTIGRIDGKSHELQKADSIFFDVYVDSDKLKEGQCTMLRAALLMSDTETELRFHQLSLQVPNILVFIQSHFPFFGNNNIQPIQAKRVTVDGNPYIKYELLEVAVCPNGNVKIPPISIHLQVAKDSSTLTFWSDELEITTSPFSKINLPSDKFNSRLVGHFESKVSNEEIRSSVNDTISLSFEIWGEGNLFPAVLPRIENEAFIATPIVKSFYDSIINYSYWSKKTFDIEIIPKNKGTYQLQLQIPYYSIKDRGFKILKSLVNLEFSGDTVNLNKSFDHPELVLLLDISKSMDVQDYYQNRLERGLGIINTFLEHKCQPLYIISGRALLHRLCEIDNEVLSHRTRGTSIANGLWFAVEYLKNVTNKKKGIVLISDGDGTSGNVNTYAAIDFAKRLGIRVCTIGIGTSGKVRFGKDAYGRTMYIENTFDDKTLKVISEESGGQYFHVPVNSDGSEIINEIMNLLR